MHGSTPIRFDGCTLRQQAVDSLLFDELRESDVVVTNAHGAFDGPIAAFVLASILAHDKQLHLSKNLQQQNVWSHREVQRTAGQNALVIGTGRIGRATARLLKAVGMNVLGAGRTVRHEDPDFNKVVPSVELAAHAEWADHLVLIAPLTQETRGILGTEVLAAMKPSAHVVNVGRGALVDEEALVQALRSGQVAAASLDVFDVEPLPARIIRSGAWTTSTFPRTCPGMLWAGGGRSHSSSKRTSICGWPASRWLTKWIRSSATSPAVRQEWAARRISTCSPSVSSVKVCPEADPGYCSNLHRHTDRHPRTKRPLRTPRRQGMLPHNIAEDTRQLQPGRARLSNCRREVSAADSCM